MLNFFENLYKKKPNGRYEKLNHKFLDLLSIPKDKTVTIIRHSENGMSFFYDDIQIEKTTLELLSAVRFLVLKLTDLILENSKPNIKIDEIEIRKKEDGLGKLTPEQSLALENLRNLLPNKELSVFCDSKYDIIKESIEQFINQLPPKTNDFYEFKRTWEITKKYKSSDLRNGQYLMILLSEYNPRLYEQIQDTQYDSFNLEENVEKTLEYIEKNWYN